MNFFKIEPMLLPKLKPNIIGIISAVLLAASALLPFFSVYVTMTGETNNVSLTDIKMAAPVLATAAVTAVLSVIGLDAALIAAGIISAVIAYIEVVSVSKVDFSAYGGTINKEIGLYLIVLGSAGVIVSGIWGLIRIVLKRAKTKNPG